MTSQEPSGIDIALERNRAFASARGHEGAVVFPQLRLFVLTCCDPRTDPAHFLGLDLSDALVVRNVGGRVTPEVINDVAYLGQLAESFLPEGPLFEVAVIHHTQCGTGALADDTFRGNYARRIGVDEATLRDHAVLDPAATVATDVERLRRASAVPERVTVSGHVYDVVTGLMETVAPARAPYSKSKAPDWLDYFREIYDAFNRRDVDAVVGVMADDVEWPNAWEGGRLVGHDAVRRYWLRQWGEIDPRVEPLSVDQRPDGRLAVSVRQLVRSPGGELLSDGVVLHVYELRQDLIARMDVEEQGAPVPS